MTIKITGAGLKTQGAPLFVGETRDFDAATEAAYVATGKAVYLESKAEITSPSLQIVGSDNTEVVTINTETGQLSAGASVLEYAPYSNRITGTRNGVLTSSAQFKGASDTSASLGQIGAIINTDTNSAAGSRFQAGDADYKSTINGASATGKSIILGPFPTYVLRVNLAVLGLTGPYVVKTSGTVDSATYDMLRIDFATEDAVEWVEIVESAPTNYAGSSGTGSARIVTVLGLKRAA